MAAAQGGEICKSPNERDNDQTWKAEELERGNQDNQNTKGQRQSERS
jgi:hypothetical protein